MSVEVSKKPMTTRMRVVVEYEVTARNAINIPASLIHVASGCKEITGTKIELRRPRVDVQFKGIDFTAVARMETNQALMVEKLSAVVEQLAKVDPTGVESKNLVDDARGLLQVISSL